MHASGPVDPSQSKLFAPLVLGNLSLSHRIVLAPLTRNRASSSEAHKNTWVPNELNTLYYYQRATPGGLLISEATPISRRASGSLGVPGIYTLEQCQGWASITKAVHDKQGFIFCQLWHQGRAAHSRLTGLEPWSSSAVPIQTLHRAKGYDPAPFDTPHSMTYDEIQEVHQEYITAARNAIASGFDGVEVHACNGYLPDQFHHSNINVRMDEYSGSPEARCRFTIELAQKLCDAIGSDKVGVRLAPFGLYNETRGDDRRHQWTYLCSALSKLEVAYVHLIEPRFDEWRSEGEKLELLHRSDTKEEVSLRPYREAIRSPTKCIVAGGYHPGNCWEGVEKGEHDAVAFGRWFVSNPDLVERLRTGKPLYRYDRSLFYGPFDNNEIGYTVHLSREFADETDIGRAQMV
ncbi:NADPH dehydrogenase [Gloeophyllum trabeum ATCC 11539]|uniref:NADPH dehydrogenase n=1 Tax=Gloeophyllum trabeum (strain ATCC 11539 / FP-39264 / Madison 617) TaxID=670483 RepID=S7RKH3_GLOTA|nr:NADPH dehydrogenase [Gloeophyllum trabeum ATCC 11539]EPQ53164.1 NADPH dehydrogenase [Gloeophyllum trabeum ATCC 11539]